VARSTQVSKELIEIRLRTSGTYAPYIVGTRIRVSDIAEYYRLAESLDEDPVRYILEALPHLNRAEVRAAISYWRDHKDQIEAEIAADEEVLKSIPTRI
jgi:uncharacterized protein (DUF433 family)